MYGIVGRLDNCNFARSTVWEGQIAEGETFVYDRGRSAGHQYIHESTDLATVRSAHYSFLLSSHTLEHCANPLKALHEWTRVLIDGGTLVLVVPHYEGTFDHRRAVTTLAHLEDDFERGVGEDDLTHLSEILDRHDLSRDPLAGDPGAFKARSERNVENRCLHHHVFDTELVVRMLDRVGLQVVDVEPRRPYHIVAIARKVMHRPENVAFLDGTAPYRRRSPFLRDRKQSTP